MLRLKTQVEDNTEKNLVFTMSMKSLAYNLAEEQKQGDIDEPES